VRLEGLGKLIEFHYLIGWGLEPQRSPVLVHRYSNMEAILLAAQYYRNVKSVQNGCKV
jgi:hypothetical protein